MDEFMRSLLGLPEQASYAAEAIDSLHYFVIITTMIGATGVGIAALRFLIRYRRSREDTQYEPSKRGSPLLEAVIIGGLLSLFILWWVLGYRIYLDIERPPEGEALDIYVTAKQWMWTFSYPDGGENIGLLTVPVNTPVRLHMTSRDVIHSLFVPAFRLKRDVLPGSYSTTDFVAKKTGVYELFCAEYCGLSHSRMRAQVVVLGQGDYERWQGMRRPNLLAEDGERSGRDSIDERRLEAGASTAPGRQLLPEMNGMARRGRDAAARHGCFSCHTIDGQTHIGPSWRGRLGERIQLVDGGSALVDEAYLTESMMDPLVKIAAGYQPVMPSYQGILDVAEVAEIIEFIRAIEQLPEPETPDLPDVDVGPREVIDEH